MTAHHGPIVGHADEFMATEAALLGAALDERNIEAIERSLRLFCHEGLWWDPGVGDVAVCSHTEHYGKPGQHRDYNEALIALGRVVHRRMLDGWGGC